MGYIASRHPQANLVVMANDRGYGPMIDHAIGLGFAARQIGFAIDPPAISPQPADALTTPPAEDLLRALARVEASLQKTTSRPAKEASLVAAIASLLGEAANVESVPAVLSGLLAGGKVSIEAAGRVSYAFG